MGRFGKEMNKFQQPIKINFTDGGKYLMWVSISNGCINTSF